MRQLFQIAGLRTVGLGIVALCWLFSSVQAQIVPSMLPVHNRASVTVPVARRTQQLVDSLQRLTQPGYYQALFTAKLRPQSAPNVRLTANVCNTYLCSSPATPLSVSLTNSGPLTCTVASATLTATSSPDTGGTYTFAGPDGAVAGSGNTAVVTRAGTYTVTFSKSGSQPATATATVTDSSQTLTATISGALTVCAGATTSLTASGGTTFLWSTQATTATVLVPAGAYSVTVTTGSCQAVASATVSATQCTPANTAPIATANGSQTATQGRPFSYTVNAFTDAETPNSLTYSATLDPTDIGLNFDPVTRVISGTPSQPGPVSVMVTATDPDQLSASTSFTINVGPIIVGSTPLRVTLTANPQTLLTSGSTVIRATASGGNAGSPPNGYTYYFSGPGDLATSSGNEVTASNLPAGVQSFTVVVSDATQPVSQTASATVSVTVTSPAPVNTAPVATANPSQTVTVGVAFSYTVNAFTDAETPDSLTYTLSINPANGLTFNPATRVLSGTPTATGPSGVTLTATDPGGLSASTSFSVTATSAPISAPVITTQPALGSAVCAGSRVQASVEATGSNLTYQWYKAGTLVSGQTSATLTLLNVTVGQAGSYQAVVSSGASSVTSTAFSLTVNALPSVSISPSATTICAGQAATLAATPGLASYQWSTGQTTATVSVSASGTYSVTATSTSGCSATATAGVTVNTPPTASLLVSGTLTCQQTSVTLTATPTGSSYVFSAGTTQVGMTNQALVSTSGLYSVTVISGNGCSAVAQTSVASGTGLVSITNPTLSTATQGVAFSQAFTTAGGVAPYRYSLISGSLPAGLSLATTGVLSGTPTQTGSFTLTARATDANGCSGVSAPYSLTVSEPIIVGALRLIAPLYNCQTGAITFRSVGGNGSGTPVEYRAIGVTDWTTNPNQTVDLPVRQDANAQPLLLQARQNGVMVTYTFDFRLYCNSTVPNQAPVFNGPLAAQSGTVGSGFTYQLPAGVFTDPNAGDVLTYSASGLPAGLQFAASSQSISGQPTTAGTYSVSLTATDGGGLSASGLLTITISTSATPPPTGPQPLAVIQPQYDCTTGAITFRTTGGDGSPIYFTSVGIVGYSTQTSYVLEAAIRNDANSQPLLIKATQSGVTVSYVFDFRLYCNGTVVTNPPVFTGPLPTQMGQVGVSFSYQLPPNSFTALNGGPFNYAVTGLPAGLSFTAGSNLISGVPTQAGSFTATITATDPLNQSGQGPLVFSIAPAPAQPPVGQPLTLVAPLYDCNTGSFTFQTSGGDGSPIEYFAVGITGFTTVAGPYTVRPAGDAQPFTLKARQRGVEVSYTWDFKAVCSGSTRMGVSETLSPLVVQVLGNPVVGDQLEVLVRGAQGQPLRYELMDVSGQVVSERQVESAGVVDQQRLPLTNRHSGLLLLRVSTPTQRQTVKVLHP